jgi:hypothetical protein
MDTSSSSSTRVSESSRGYLARLTFADNRPTLYVRRPGNDSEEVHTFHDDDPFLSEMATFINLSSKGESELPVLSSYADGECRCNGDCLVAETVHSGQDVRDDLGNSTRQREDETGQELESDIGIQAV